ncbi:hypothetical protein JX265_011100 [Neoarthrinium moseri]|uniref:tRNA-splicing endonuclease subunit Sen34 n=1 Tax=Neoarthrinium moseri TaxID=1658444 RepID=A0A9Q0AL33_9PEZI|nr:uncharacterized protein JN550_005081 [Neoarthrinium moseri]KAI1857685.1 hypothetical protein JX265_011100 [Neoarthrinium moseri]KAI1870538.1 hypothetical protein JN550_005081 [Neoarthrinium moseri]
MASETPKLPIRISKVTDRYLLFDIDDVMYLRRNHNICSPFVGTMPQAPSQSVFMSLPIELMAEEATVLVEKGVAYIADDSVFHPSRIVSPDAASRNAYLQDLRRDGTRAAAAARELAEYKKANAASKGKGKKKDKKLDSGSAIDKDGPVSEEISLFDSSSTRETKPKAEPRAPDVWAVTPATSGALLTPPPEEDTSALLDVPAGYPLYAHLHENGYFMMPGLRFGCDYNVYPGDPLRFHSHFQATHYAWNEEISLLDLVTGGRLGTNVKKSYLIGGAIRSGNDKEEEADEKESHVKNKASSKTPVRAFSIEWAAM